MVPDICPSYNRFKEPTPFLAVILVHTAVVCMADRSLPHPVHLPLLQVLQNHWSPASFLKVLNSSERSCSRQKRKVSLAFAFDEVRAMCFHDLYRTGMLKKNLNSSEGHRPGSNATYTWRKTWKASENRAKKRIVLLNANTHQPKVRICLWVNLYILYSYNMATGSITFWYHSCIIK